MAGAVGKTQIAPSALDGSIELVNNSSWERLAFFNPRLAALITGKPIQMGLGEAAGSFKNGYIPYPANLADILTCYGIYSEGCRYTIDPLVFQEPARAASGELVYKVCEIVVGGDGIIPQRNRTLSRVVDLFFCGQDQFMRENESAREKRMGGYTYCYYYIVTNSGDAKVITISCALVPP